MKIGDFDYDLPPEFIAQTPVEPRDASRLMVLDRNSGSLTHTYFREIGQFLRPGDLLVLNETRVIPARLLARKTPTGGKAEVLLLRKLGQARWEALVGGKGLVPGVRLQIDGGPQAEITSDLGGSRRILRFEEGEGGDQALFSAGHVPLPPYIHTPLQDPERYQTVYSRQEGSAAAPTAGLHFTPALLAELQSRGIATTAVTLHVGLDTFAPVAEARPEEHAIHTEWCQVTPQAARAVEAARREGGSIIAVGTTCVRTLESAAAQNGQVAPYEGPTGLFILPGYEFKVVDCMVTNFHLPRSTLIMLVSAFTGRERIMAAYETAKQEGYRFYSFGDAMLIL
jgi:S-adenosylmethionine:tRNA ribosyltransferase-isomerase